MPILRPAALAVLLAGPLAAGPLHDVVRAGDTAEAQRLIAGGADVNEVDFLAGSPLHIAALKGHVGLIDVLVAAGADVDAIEFGNGATALHWAALAGRTDAARRLLTLGSDVDAPNDAGDTPLIVALENRHIDTGAALIDGGADILAETEFGIRPIELAGRAGGWALVDRLVDLGARPPEPEPVTPHLANADTERAETFWWNHCGLCHGAVTRASMRDDADELGPPLWNVLGSAVAGVEGYPYSEALRREGGVWTYEKLNRLLADPGGYWPGTAKINTVSGREIKVPDVADRADVIEYMRVNADPVPPLP